MISCPLPLMTESKSVPVVVDITDPMTGDKLGPRTQNVMRTTKLPEASHVATDTADMYSIENMTKAGITPVVMSSSYIDQRLDKLPEAENLSRNLLLQVEEAEARKAEAISFQSTNSDETKTE